MLEGNGNGNGKALSLVFWRTLAVGLMTFILGNGTSFIVFGLHTASKNDVKESRAATDSHLSTLDIQMNSLEQAVQNIAGQLYAKKMIEPPRRLP